MSNSQDKVAELLPGKSEKVKEIKVTPWEPVVKGVAVEKANENNTTVGIGASPDRSGRVTLELV